ncbi:hypothetical protein DUNSADRAFT_2688 [Dunaliella salina]|uniref:Encoded protein n=1 Tax=Dunaliella salina TaxID=3046 RepID=A0ABQ7H896_DUNSA|nr:hypothetical protein DUNSADRAFT_2688 [Dunaliella salina]|eukprot:KAF5843075.1 hypothetical protein DUNSADRAFT_2688 [Dunaliella salina]
MVFGPTHVFLIVCNWKCKSPVQRSSSIRLKVRGANEQVLQRRMQLDEKKIAYGRRRPASRSHNNCQDLDLEIELQT